MGKIIKPLHYPPYFTSTCEIAPVHLNAISYYKREYEKAEEDYMLYLYDKEVIPNGGDDNTDYRHYVHTNAYYKINKEPSVPESQQTPSLNHPVAPSIIYNQESNENYSFNQLSAVQPFSAIESEEDNYGFNQITSKGTCSSDKHYIEFNQSQQTLFSPVPYEEKIYGCKQKTSNCSSVNYSRDVNASKRTPLTPVLYEEENYGFNQITSKGTCNSVLYHEDLEANHETSFSAVEYNQITPKAACNSIQYSREFDNSQQTPFSDEFFPNMSDQYVDPKTFLETSIKSSKLEDIDNVEYLPKTGVMFELEDDFKMTPYNKIEYNNIQTTPVASVFDEKNYVEQNGSQSKRVPRKQLFPEHFYHQLKNDDSIESLDSINKADEVRTNKFNKLKPVTCKSLDIHDMQSSHDYSGKHFWDKQKNLVSERSCFKPFELKPTNLDFMSDDTEQMDVKSLNCLSTNQQEEPSTGGSKTHSKAGLCSVSRKLVEHQKIREEALKTKNEKNGGETSGVREQVKPQLKRKKCTEDKQDSKVKCRDSNSHLNTKKLINEDDMNCNQVRNKDEDDIMLYDDRYIDVYKLCDGDKDDLECCLLRAADISLTLIYNDGTTLLSGGHQQLENNKKKALKSSKKAVDKWVKSLALAIKGCSSPKFRDQLIVFPFNTHDTNYMLWFRNLFNKILKEKQLVAFDAQRVINILIDVFSFKDLDKKATTEWVFLDPLLGTWLLDAENSPKTVQDVMGVAKLKTQHYQSAGTVKETSWYIKAGLLQMIMAMKKIIEQLKSRHIYQLFIHIETQLIPILACMETSKIKVDMETFRKFADVLKKKLTKLESDAHQSVGHSFLLSSHPQLRQVLYEELQLDKKLPSSCKLVKTSVAHQKSTSESMLLQLSPYHSLPNIVLEYRQLLKLKSTYVDGMLICVENGCLSTYWDQIGAATGRLSSYQPNIQAIPKSCVTITSYKQSYIEGKKDESKLDIYAREPFISHNGWTLLAADFQQIELRLLAHLSEDEQLLEIFNNSQNEDIFITLTSQWLKKPVDKVSQSDREQTKRVVYSVMYGVGKERLAEYLKVSPENAKAVMNSFLIKFPAVNRFTKSCIQFCYQKGYTATLFGRRRYVPNITSHNPMLRAQAERQCVNFRVQGSAADLCKAAMIKVESCLQSYNTRLLIQIHDELVWEVEESQLSTVKGIIKEVMEDRDLLCSNMTTRIKVPICVTINTGKNWAHLVTE